MSRVVKQSDGHISINIEKIEEWVEMTVDALVHDVETGIIESEDDLHDAAMQECSEVVHRIPRPAVPLIGSHMYDMSRDECGNVMDLVERMEGRVVGLVDAETGFLGGCE